MTRPIRNTGPCFPSGLPRQRGQRDMLSHTEFYTPIFCMLSVFQAIPFELPRKPPTVNRWDSTLCTPGWGQVLQSISSPNVKCAPETTAISYLCKIATFQEEVTYSEWCVATNTLWVLFTL